jgi:hypothetical protein
MLAAVLLLAQPGAQDITRQADYQIYAAVLPATALVRNAHDTRLVIQETATPYKGSPECVPSGPAFTKGPWAEALADFTAQARIPQTWRAAFPLDLPYEIVPDVQLEAIIAGANGWSAFHADFPGSSGYIQLAPVGLSRDGTKAVAYVAHRCGMLCGEGAYHFAEKQDATWREVDAPPKTRVCTWIS